MNKEAIQAVYALQAAAGSNEKKQLLSRFAENEDFKRFLYYALHPLMTYGLSENTLRKPLPKNTPEVFVPSDFFEVCEQLSQRRALDDATVCAVRQFLEEQEPDIRELYIGVLSKTIRLGVTAKTVNKVIPDLIPAWEVQQAYPIDKYPLEEGTWFTLTQKLNGVRATYLDGKLYARSGDVYEGLTDILSEISSFWCCDRYVFDGEITLKDKGNLSDNEAFRMAAGLVNSDAGVDKSNLQFTIFDMVLVEEFGRGCSATNYSFRREFLNLMSETTFKNTEHVHILPSLYAGTDQKKIWSLLDQMVREDKEGLMVNLDVPYQRKRHNGILKVKRFYTMDLPVLRCEEGSGRLSGTLGALVLDYKGNEVNVGSGFTDEERTGIWQNREQIPGLLCEVKYKEVSSDKRTGVESLQFPIFVCLRTDKNEVSYG